MTESIESFVRRLHQEGVQAGREAGEKLLAEARQQAQRLLEESRAEGQAIVEQARAEAHRLSEQQRAELNLAIRDAVMQFRHRLSRAIEALLRREAAAALADPEFLKKLIAEMVGQYARQDSTQAAPVEVRVSPEAGAALADWALQQTLTPQGSKTPHVELAATLAHLGFECRMGPSAVEVTVESVCEVLKEYLAPALREVLEKAMGKAGEAGKAEA